MGYRSGSYALAPTRANRSCDDPELSFLITLQDLERRQLCARQLLFGQQLRHRLHLRRQAEGTWQFEVRRTPQIAPNIGTALAKANVSWKWYSGGRTARGIDRELYCSICDPLTPSTAVMTLRCATTCKASTCCRDLGDERSLPAVSFVIPPNPESGHPAYSTVSALEKFLAPLVAKVEADPVIWSETAILVTTDEGGGYYDSGYIQILDFFGDGTRIPLIVISPFAKTDTSITPTTITSRCSSSSSALAPSALVGSQPRQSAQSGNDQGRPLRAGQSSRDRGPDEPVPVLIRCPGTAAGICRRTARCRFRGARLHPNGRLARKWEGLSLVPRVRASACRQLALPGPG